jgi:hypothetical protein
MSELIITGASDDLIEIDGQIREEFTYSDNDDGDLIAVSDGTVLRIKFDGVWRITLVKRGTARVDIVQADEDDEGTDTATLDLIGSFAWVVQGSAIVKAKG